MLRDGALRRTGPRSLLHVLRSAGLVAVARLVERGRQSALFSEGG